MGKREYDCTPWGMPAYNIFGWQKPCYLLQDGYADSYQELLADTNWDNYGTQSGNPQVRELHGAQRIRGQRRERNIRIAEGIAGDCARNAFNRYDDPDVESTAHHPHRERANW